MTDAAKPQSGDGGGTRRWLWLALIASLAVNLAVAGAFAGRAWHGPHRHGGPEGLGLGGFVRMLPTERAAAVREQLKSERERIRPLRQDARAAREELTRVLGAEPFNKDAARAAAAKVVSAEAKVRETAMDTLTALAERLTPAERAALATHLQWRDRHGRGERGKGGGGGDKPAR